MMPQLEKTAGPSRDCASGLLAPCRKRQSNNPAHARKSYTHMKKKVLLLALGVMLTAVPSALQAKSYTQAYVDGYRGRTGTPVPISVVSPRVGLKYVGTEFQLAFSVDEKGRPGSIVSNSDVPEELLEAVTDAVSRWKFVPLRGADGRPTSVDVILPVEITPPK